MNELQRENQRLTGEIQSLREQLTAATAIIKKLTEQLSQNSRNSSWPSSRDKSRQPKPRSQRKRSNRKAGGQKGHQGHTLKPQAKPDEIVVHRPACCQQCQTVFATDAPTTQISKRQVLDLPPLQFVTTEHQVETMTCHQCGEKTSAAFPEAVRHPVQYGSRVKQLAVYLRTEQFVPYQRSQQLLQDLFELPVCVGSLQNFVAKAARQAEKPVAAIKQAVINAEVIHTDETGFYIGGKRHWLHTASTPQLSFLAPHPTRGHKAVDAIDILPQASGVLVHDAWPTYFLYDTDYALCHAHHLRDLTAVIENDQHLWAGQMRTFLCTAKRLVDNARDGDHHSLPPPTLARIEQLYDAIVANGLAETPLPTRSNSSRTGRLKRTKARNLAERFQKRKTEMLRFVYDFKVPFDNNLAERDIRMMKVQQKVSGCFRSDTGAEQFCKLRSYTSTLRKQGLSVWQAIGSLFDGAVLMPQLIAV